MVSLGVVLLFALTERIPADPPEKKPAVKVLKPASDVEVLAAKIDELVAQRWKANKVKPALLADDAEFLRRVSLDLTGRIPRVAEVRSFLDDVKQGKRQRLIERLLETPQFVQHFANYWRAQMLPQGNQQVQFQAPNFEKWLHKKIKENAAYDKLVRELLTFETNPQAGRRPPVNQFGETPFAFYTANEQKPENLAASASRLFLGVKLECAQCHKHPFAKWTKEQFWEFAAFFSEVRPAFFAPGRQPVPVKRGEIKMPGTDKIVKARFLDGKVPQWNKDDSARSTLVDWMTSAQNPYFAQTSVNNLWAYFFGVGLIEPIDEPENNPPSHPELLKELSSQFVAHQYDVKFLIRAITSSKAYQLSSAVTHPSQKDERLFARMSVKGMSPEQIYDSLAQAVSLPQRANVRGGVGTPRAEFLARFASTDKRTERQTSILQALALMNGKFIADATSLDRSATLAAVADAPFMNTAQKIETLFLATLTRKPRADEASKLATYVNSGGARQDARAALADVFWALLNSPEFILNH
jgi:hypothetical protein